MLEDGEAQMRIVNLCISICAMLVLTTESGHAAQTGKQGTQIVHKHIAGVKYEDAKSSPQNNQKQKGTGTVNKSRFDPYKNYKFR